MKRLKLSAIAALTLFTFSACSNDDNTPAPDSQPINYLLGKWNATSLHQKFEVDGEVLFDDLDEKGGMYGVVMTYDFKQNNIVDYYMYLPATNESEEVEYSGTTTYELEGNKLTLEHIPKVYTITLINNKNLIIHTKNEGDIEGKYYKTEEIEKYEKIKQKTLSIGKRFLFIFCLA